MAASLHYTYDARWRKMVTVFLLTGASEQDIRRHGPYLAKNVPNTGK
jgi:hypothetical protein